MKKQKKKPYFADAKVGDKVKCMMFGDGKITEMLRDEEYCQLVAIFDNFPYRTRFTLDGKFYRDIDQSLFYEDDLPVMQRWISLSDETPNDFETCWLFDEESGFVILGAMSNDIVAKSNGVIYNDKGCIVSECDPTYFDDDEFNPTHFCRLPKLPKIQNLQNENKQNT